MKRRLVLAIAGVAAAAVALFALPLAVVLSAATATRSCCASSATRSRRPGASTSPPAARDQIELPRFTAIGWRSTTARGALIAGAGPRAPTRADAQRAADPPTRPGVTAGGRLVVAVPLLTGERVTGVVRARAQPGRA